MIRSIFPSLDGLRRKKSVVTLAAFEAYTVTAKASRLGKKEYRNNLRLMSTVFITGAGASFGDNIQVADKLHPATPTSPPLINGFFRKDLFEAVKYPPWVAEKDYPDAFKWIRVQVPAVGEIPIGEPPWDQINLEEVFTSVELYREFESPESDAGSMLRIIRNQLVRYISRILALCTQN